MTDHTAGSLGRGLVLEERLPLRWRAAGPAGMTAVHLQHDNEATLRALLSLDQHHIEVGEEGTEVAHELERLESKLNLVLDLLGQVLAHQLDIPPAVPVWLAAHQVEWQGEPPAAPGGGVLELYLSTRYPRPLYLPATLHAAGGGRVRATFGELGEPVQDLLEQLIFRHHRRQIAATRRGA